MKKNLGMFLGLPRRGARAVLPALFTFTAACVLSVSSAQAATTFSTFNANGSSTASSSDFSDSATLGAPSGTDTVLGSGGSSLLITDNHLGGGGSSTLTFTLDNTAGGNVNLASLQYAYSASVNGSATISWSLNTVSAGSQVVFNGAKTDTINLVGVVPDNSVFTLVGTLTGTANANNINFSSFSITAVPEPINYALAGFGLIFVGVGAGRFYLGRRRSVTAS
jgi:hypothetical protein